ncbi:MAG: hypothetical protein Q9226_001048 [Calogaya cf. arnoldii]
MTGPSSTHEDRTAAAQREADLYQVKIAQIQRVNESFLPGQWLDVHLPRVRQAGGFTITSTPKDAQPAKANPGYLELAIQKSPNNPPAAWLWRPEEEIRDSHIYVRVGGNFVWPPPGIDLASIKTIALVAGGVGINPLMSILTHLRQDPDEPKRTISFIYGTRAPQSKDLSKILFLDRLRARTLMGHQTKSFVKLYLTQCSEEEMVEMRNRYFRPTEEVINIHSTFARRIDREALHDAVNHTDAEWRKNAVVYICGPPRMTDKFENFYLDMGMEKGRVLTEKWW